MPDTALKRFLHHLSQLQDLAEPASRPTPPVQSGIAQFPKKGGALGGGRRFQQDVPRRNTTDLLRSVHAIGAAGAANGGSLADANEYCARTHLLSFLVTAQTPPNPGDPITVGHGDPPYVLTPMGPIGRLQGRAVEAIKGCLELEWVLAGEVRSVDATTGEGVIVVTGSR